jgi:L-malate glycosyltransferase
VLRLAELLPRYGYRASILTFSIHPESTALEAAHCPVYLLPLKRTYGFAALLAAFELRRFLKAQSVELVQTFFESSDLWAGLVTRAMSKAKLIWSRRDMGILRTRKHQITYRIFAGLPDAVFAVSEQVRRHCIEVDRIDASRVYTVYNGLDLPNGKYRSRFPKESDRTVLLTVGNIRRVKGHDVLIRAVAPLMRRDQRLMLYIAGDVLEQLYFNELQSLVKKLDLEQRIQFLGGIRNLESQFSRADIFVLPSRSEGFSNAIVEAMAASLPVIATDVGGNAEAVVDGITGYIVAPEDPDALRTAIEKLLADPAMAMRMGVAGRSQIAERFTTEAMMSGIVAIYRKLLRVSESTQTLAETAPR